MALKCLVTFLPTDRGGRKTPPRSTYSTVAKFESAADGDWSIVLKFREQPRLGVALEADISFLSTEAPKWLLFPGSKFELYEGARHVADVVVVE